MAAPDFAAITEKQRATWSSGDFHEIARQNVVMAEAEGFDVDLRVADAQELPFEDASFDVVLSVYGVQFVPDQHRAAQELLRVCRPGGRIGLAGPMPEGWSGDFFAVHGRHNPPPPGVAPPLRWGTEEGPTLKALEAVGPEGEAEVLGDLAAVFDRYNRADDGTAVIENTYLQTVATRAGGPS